MNQTANNRIFFKNPIMKNAITGVRSNPFATKGRFSLMGLKIDSVTPYKIIANFPLGSCGIQLIKTLISIRTCNMSKMLPMTNLKSRPIELSTYPINH